MTYKGIVFFDLDGTLLNAASQVSPENRKALDQLKLTDIYQLSQQAVL